MASAIVTLKVTPQELQVIDQALRMWSYASGNLHDNAYAHPLERYQHDLTMVGGNPLQATMIANKLRKDIGFK